MNFWVELIILVISVLFCDACEAPGLQKALFVNFVVVFFESCVAYIYRRLLVSNILAKRSHIAAFNLAGWLLRADYLKRLFLLRELLEDFVLKQEVATALAARFEAFDTFEISLRDDQLFISFALIVVAVAMIFTLGGLLIGLLHLQFFHDIDCDFGLHRFWLLDLRLLRLDFYLLNLLICLFISDGILSIFLQGFLLFGGALP